MLEVKKELEALSSLKSSGSKDEKKLFIELCYKRELGISAREYLEETIKALPENMSVVNWKITDPEAFFARNEVRDFEASEVKNLDEAFDKMTDENITNSWVEIYEEKEIEEN